MKIASLAALEPPRCFECPLRCSKAFTPVTHEELMFIEAFRTQTAVVPAGGEIVPEQKSTGKLYTLYSGWAFRFKTLRDGRRQILSFLLPGDFFGLQEQFVDDATQGVEAATDVAMCIFPRDGLWDLYREHPSLGYDITWLAARQEGMVDDNLLTVGRRTAAERVAMLLMHLYRRAEKVGLASDNSIAFPITQQHIADALGLSLVHTNKTLRRLQLEGLHEFRDGRLRIVNPKALARIAEYYDTPLRQTPLM